MMKLILTVILMGNVLASDLENVVLPDGSDLLSNLVIQPSCDFASSLEGTYDMYHENDSGTGLIKQSEIEVSRVFREREYSDATNNVFLFLNYDSTPVATEVVRFQTLAGVCNLGIISIDGADSSSFEETLAGVKVVDGKVEVFVTIPGVSADISDDERLIYIRRR